MREGVSSQGYGAIKHKTPDTGQMKSKQFNSHKLIAPREEDTVPCRDTGGCTREQSEPQGTVEGLSKGWGAPGSSGRIRLARVNVLELERN